MSDKDFRQVAVGKQLPAGTNPFRAPQQAPEPQNWREWASCRETDPEIFHPEKGKSAQPAKQICANCPVQFDCLEYALDNDMRFGVWGGLSDRERRGLRRRTQYRIGVAARRERIAQLSAGGMTGADIAVAMRMTSRQVLRDLAAMRAAS
jgi:DNA-binding CsgD family transcriptional regulator